MTLCPADRTIKHAKDIIIQHRARSLLSFQKLVFTWCFDSGRPGGLDINEAGYHRSLCMRKNNSMILEMHCDWLL
jgi:hypothetical protein